MRLYVILFEWKCTLNICFICLIVLDTSIYTINAIQLK